MRRIAVINQKGGVGKTTTCANLGAALARLGRRVVLVDMDAQANLSMHLAVEVGEEEPSSYSVLRGKTTLAAAIRPTKIQELFLVPSHLELSGAELELASVFGRETLLRIAVEDWEREERARTGAAPADYLIFDCPPSLGLLSINALAASSEVLIALQTEFFALQGMSTLVDVVQLLKRRLHPTLEITGILPCLYDSRLKLAREVLAEIRRYFPGKVFRTPIRSNIKLAEAPSFGLTIFEYAPESNGALDYVRVAEELLEGETRDAELATKPRAAWKASEAEAQPDASAPGVAVPAAEAPAEFPSSAPGQAVNHSPLENVDLDEPVAAAGGEDEPAPFAPAEVCTVARGFDLEELPEARSAAFEPPASSPEGPEIQPLSSREFQSDPNAGIAAESEARIDDRIHEETSVRAPEAERRVTPEKSSSAAGERTYVLQPAPARSAALALGPSAPLVRAGRGSAAGSSERPNDLLTLCLRSLRSLWRS